MNRRILNAISGRLSLRPPQAESLEKQQQQVPSSAALARPEVQRAMVEQVKERLTPIQGELLEERGEGSGAMKFISHPGVERRHFSPALRPLPSSLPHINPLLRRHHIQRHIPGIRLQRVHPLTLVGDADEQGAPPALSLPQVGEGAVVIAAPHAHAVAVGIESDQWDEQQVQRPGKADAAIAQPRFRDAVAVLF